ncbi:MAG: HAD-IC family P-type ATPase [Bacteroidota bacterium]
MTESKETIQGLDEDAVQSSREKHGANKIEFKKEHPIADSIKSIIKEPMVLLLLLASVIYFISGDIGDAVFLAISIVLVATISLFQDSRSRKALEKLKSFTQEQSKVIRNGIKIALPSTELVIGDCIIVEEGSLIAADAVILQSNDFSVNESILTGESLAVFKDAQSENNKIYSGTSVASGQAIARVISIGNNTELSKIGKSIEAIEDEKTPLELQIEHFVKIMVILGAIVFAIVWAINYSLSRNVLDSLLKALTLAMSILPEEIPVAFTTFMALGAWRLMKMGIVVKQMKTVETLGSATVICTDKTGTLTENKMSLAQLYVLSENKITVPNKALNEVQKELISLAMWSSEPIPFDPMEIALHLSYLENADVDLRSEYKMIFEYPLDGKPPMMTHIYEHKNGNRIIAAKGAPEALMAVSELSNQEKEHLLSAIKKLADQGYRLLAVAEAIFRGDDFPKTQQEFKFNFLGIVAFSDPPKHNIETVLQSFYNAGIKVKIITGDNPVTTMAIARQVGFEGAEKAISGDELMALNDDELKVKVNEINVFTRMFPEAKLRIINALKANNEIVAMTGDGVNDGPALKAAHIGIAMGKRGSEIAKQAASLVLTEDDLSKMVDAVAMGRRIYTNLKKAIRYVISIHIPIILTVFIPLALGWIYPNIFTPVHVIFLELIMGPTCSIIYENEPMEENTMNNSPRPFSSTFFSWSELYTSIIQGLAITAGTLIIYQYSTAQGWDEATTRTMVFTVMIAANIMLTLVNRSFYYSVFTTLFYKNNLVVLILSVTILLTIALIYIPVPAAFFGFKALDLQAISLSIFVGLTSVLWYEIIKWIKRIRKIKDQ